MWTCSHFQTRSGCWQNSFPPKYRIWGPSFLLAIVWELLQLPWDLSDVAFSFFRARRSNIHCHCRILLIGNKFQSCPHSKEKIAREVNTREGKLLDIILESVCHTNKIMKNVAKLKELGHHWDLQWARNISSERSKIKRLKSWGEG